MHVLMVADGTRGDVEPIRTLGAALQSEGHRVVVAAPPGTRDFVEAAALEFVPLRYDIEPTIRAHAADIVSGTRGIGRAGRQMLYEVLASQFEVLPELARSADVIFTGGIVAGAPSVAERYGIPWRSLLWSVNALPSAAHPPQAVPFGRAPRLVNQLIWRLSAWGMGLYVADALHTHRARLGLPRLSRVAAHFFSEHPIIATEPELAPLPPEYAHIDVIGQLTSVGPALSDELEDFLARGPAPIYIGFGSMPDPDPDATTRLFVKAARRCGARLVLSRGWANFGRTLRPSDDCLVIGPVSHARLFPRVAGAVHHGGSGTTAASARAGVPQLVVPHLADQFFFGARVHELGVGPKPLPRSRLSLSALSGRLEKLLYDPRICANAATLGRNVRARPPLSNVSRLLDLPRTHRAADNSAGVVRMSL